MSELVREGQWAMGFMLTIALVFALIVTTISAIACVLIKVTFQTMRKAKWYRKFWDKYIEPKHEIPEADPVGLYCVGECDECGECLYEEDECLPDYPGIYQCPSCSHPNARSK